MDEKIENEIKQFLTEFWHEESLDLGVDEREPGIVVMDPSRYSDEVRKQSLGIILQAGKATTSEDKPDLTAPINSLK